MVMKFLRRLNRSYRELLKTRRARKIARKTRLPLTERLCEIHSVAGPSSPWITIGFELERERLQTEVGEYIDAVLMVHGKDVPDHVRSSLLFLLGNLKPYRGDFMSEAILQRAAGDLRIKQARARKAASDAERER